MVFFYSRKIQVLMFMLWCIGMAVMYTGVIGGDVKFFGSDDDRTPVENLSARIGAMPESTPSAPAPPPPTPQAPPPPAEENYIIREGDTVNKIARHHGLDPASIITRNRLTDPDFLRPGDTLILPPPGDDPQTAEESRHTRHGVRVPSVDGRQTHGARHETPPARSPAATPPAGSPDGRQTHGARHETSTAGSPAATPAQR
jgi:LysM repeat protein